MKNCDLRTRRPRPKRDEYQLAIIDRLSESLDCERNIRILNEILIFHTIDITERILHRNICKKLITLANTHEFPEETFVCLSNLTSISDSINDELKSLRISTISSNEFYKTSSTVIRNAILIIFINLGDISLVGVNFGDLLGFGGDVRNVLLYIDEYVETPLEKDGTIQYLTGVFDEELILLIVSIMTKLITQIDSYMELFSYVIFDRILDTFGVCKREISEFLGAVLDRWPESTPIIKSIIDIDSLLCPECVLLLVHFVAEIPPSDLSAVIEECVFDSPYRDKEMALVLVKEMLRQGIEIDKKTYSEINDIVPVNSSGQN